MRDTTYRRPLCLPILQPGYHSKYLAETTAPRALANPHQKGLIIDQYLYNIDSRRPDDFQILLGARYSRAHHTTNIAGTASWPKRPKPVNTYITIPLRYVNHGIFASTITYFALSLLRHWCFIGVAKRSFLDSWSICLHRVHTYFSALQMNSRLTGCLQIRMGFCKRTISG